MSIQLQGLWNVIKIKDFILRLILDFSKKIEFQVLAQIVIHGIIDKIIEIVRYTIRIKHDLRV